MSDLIKKYIIKDNKEDVFHTSAYSKAQSGSSMGSSSSMSFNDRLAIDRNRQKVQGYQNSSIMSGNNLASGVPRPKTFTPERGMGGPSCPPKSPSI